MTPGHPIPADRHTPNVYAPLINDALRQPSRLTVEQPLRSFRSSLPEGRRASAGAPAKDSDDLSLSVHTDPDAIEPVWRELERTAPMSVYQRFDWLRPWCRLAAPALAVEPAIVLGCRHGRPAFLLPLGRRRSPLGALVEWLGGSHVNVGLGLFAPDFLATLDESSVRRLVSTAMQALAPIDVLALRNQPWPWHGQSNPLRHLAGRVDDQSVMAIALPPSINHLLTGPAGARKRKKLRWQENALAPVGGYRFMRAGNAAEATRLFDAFLAQKAAQFAQSGIDNVFADPGTERFFRDLIARSVEIGDPLIELYAIEIDGEIRATFAAGVDRGRVHGYFSGIRLDAFQRISPGELLLFNLVRASCERGLEVLDLGVGDERYKASWLPVCERQFATFLPATLRRPAGGGVPHGHAGGAPSHPRQQRRLDPGQEGSAFRRTDGQARTSLAARRLGNRLYPLLRLVVGSGLAGDEEEELGR